MALPVAWVTGAIASYLHPGDEGGIFVVSTIAGSWVLFLVHNIDHLRDVLWIVLLTGAVILAALGFMMDRLRMSKRAWGTLFGLCFVVVLVLGLRQ